MTWVKGQSGNPSGRPKVAGLIKELAKKDAPEMYAALREMAKTAANEMVRVKAITACLAYAGVAVPREPEPETAEEESRLASLSDEELDQLLKGDAH